MKDGPKNPEKSPRRGARRSDAQLIRACLSGDGTAWDALLTRYARFIYAIALHAGLTEDDAADVLQMVSMSLLDHLADLRNADRLAPWIATVTRRHAMRVRSRNSRAAAPIPVEHASAFNGGVDVTENFDEALMAQYEQQLVQEAIERLPPKCRDLLHLLFSEESLSYADIAERLNMPVGSIGPNRARCLQQLRKALEELGF